jgi:hypothetical protein
VHRPDTDSDRRLARQLLLGRIQLALGWAFLVTFVAFAVWGRFPVPYRDDWDWLSAYLTRPMTISGLLEPHNEHMIPLPRVLFAVQYWLEGASFRLSFLIALSAQLLIGWVFWRQIRERWPNDVAMRSFAWGVAAIALFITYQLQSIVFVAAILFPLVQMFVVLACHAAARASSEDDRGHRRRWVAAFCASLAAALTTTNGLVAPGIVALFAIGRRRRSNTWILIALLLLQAACVATYVIFVRRPWDRAPTAPGQGWAATSATTLLEFFLSFFSSGLVYGGPAIGVAIGTLVFVAGVACLFATARDGARSRAVERFACGLLLFTMASAAMTTVGRAQFGIVQAAQSRYATYTLVYWSAMVIWMLSRLDRRDDARGHWKPRLMGLGIVVAVGGLAIQLFVGLVWIAKKDNLRLAALTLATGVDDQEWVSTLHPLVQSVYTARALMIADGKWRLTDPRIGTGQGVPVSNCDGDVHLSGAAGGAGWRVAAVIHTRSQEALIVDRSGIAIGLAEVAPVVDTPNPSQMDVVTAVWRRLRGQAASSDRWVGLARVGAGPPYTLLAMDESGHAECQLPAR